MSEAPQPAVSVTVFDDVALTAGVTVTSSAIPISVGARGVQIDVVCDYVAVNEFRLKYVEPGGREGDIATLVTPADAVQGVWCRYIAQSHLAGQLVAVSITAENDGIVTVTGTPIF